MNPISPPIKVDFSSLNPKLLEFKKLTESDFQAMQKGAKLSLQASPQLEEITKALMPIIVKIAGDGDIMPFEWGLLRNYIVFQTRNALLKVFSSNPDFPLKGGEAFPSYIDQNLLLLFFLFEKE